MKQDPVQRAKEVYMREDCARSFEEDFYLHWHNPRAIVYKDANNLAFLRPVNRANEYDLLTDPSWNSDNPNCWWVYLLVGDFRFLLTLLPYELEYIGWERNNVPRSYKLSHLKRWILKTHPTSTETSLVQTDVSCASIKEVKKRSRQRLPAP